VRVRVYACMHVCAYVCAFVGVCVCVREMESERESVKTCFVMFVTVSKHVYATNRENVYVTVLSMSM